MTAINISAFIDKISDFNLEKLCADNPEIRFETTPQGRLIVMSPTGSESGKLNGDLFFQVELWNRRYKLGVTFDSSTGFKLCNGAIRSPDVSWVENAKWDSLSKQLQRKFAPIDPDFVIELMSPTDDLAELQQKMLEYRSCGVRLGWLINPDDREVEIYRPDVAKEILGNPTSLSGGKILPELTVDLSAIF